MLADKLQNWNNQHWSNTIFDDESRVSLCESNGHTLAFRCLERLVGSCIQETDGIRWHDDYSGGDWPWTDHQISDETSADGSSFGACLPTCIGGSDDDESVWGIGLDVFSDIQPLLNMFRPCGQRQGVQFAWSAPPWFWTAKTKLFRLQIRRRACSYFDVFSSTDAYVTNPWVRPLLSRTQHRAFWMAPCGTPVVLGISFWESPRPENWTLFFYNLITSWIVVGMISTMFSDNNLHTIMAHSWTWLTQMRHIAFGAISEINY